MRWCRRSGVAALAALVLVGCLLAVIPETASAQNGPGFGFASLTTFASKTTTEFNNDAAQVKAVGGTWVRLYVAWGAIEGNQGQFDWSTIDPAVTAARANGANVLMCLMGPAPFWAQGLVGNPLDRGATPADPASFGRFAAAAATRYQAYAGTWEIWNEPNASGYWSSPNVPNYIQVLKAGYQAIHAVQPGAVVITGGVTSTPDAQISETDFVNQLYANGARPYLDGIGMHPYTIPYGVSDDPKHTWNDLAVARATMTNYGDSAKKIWITEWGIATGTSASASTEDQQAAKVVDALQIAAATPYLAPLFLFTVKDWGTDANNPDMNFGVYRYDGSPKAAAFAIQRFATGSTTTPPTTTTTTVTTTAPPTTSPPRTTTLPPTTTGPPTPAPEPLNTLGHMVGLW
jgi:polysaccharide biosynthesis protein PslG